ncbi:MAG: FAD-dependent oxidoreductase [bacterium]|nr:FAD-dependent oxidoreductase [bacterium]
MFKLNVLEIDNLFGICVLEFPLYSMYDLIIIGAGPAGLCASIYASRYKIKHLVIGKEIGGQIIKTSRIENWPGIESISGPELIEKFSAQAKKLGAEIIKDEVGKVKKQNDYFEIETASGGKYEAKNIILALGMKPRKLDVPGEEKFIGKGVSYCAICDAIFFRGKDVAVIGGGDSAAKAAIHLGEFANKVYIFYLKDNLTMEPMLLYRIKNNERLEMIPYLKTVEIRGGEKVSGIVCNFEKGDKEIPISGVFIETGSVPGVEIAREIGVEIDKDGYIIVKSDQSTNIPGVYSAGDATTGSNKFRQLITAVSEGAISAGSVYHGTKLNGNNK